MADMEPLQGEVELLKVLYKHISSPYSTLHLSPRSNFGFMKVIVILFMELDLSINEIELKAIAKYSLNVFDQNKSCSKSVLLSAIYH